MITPQDVTVLPPTTIPEDASLTYDQYYRLKLQQGKEYEDFLMLHLLRKGKLLQVFTSAKYQRHYGETVQGIEIKYDGKTAKTGNYFFEHHERRVTRGDMVPSGYLSTGPYCDLYLIGNYCSAAVILVSRLLTMHDEVYEGGATYGQHRDVKVDVANNGRGKRPLVTGQGIIVSRDYAEKVMAIARMEFDGTGYMLQFVAPDAHEVIGGRL